MSMKDWLTNNNNITLNNYLYGPRHIIMILISLVLVTLLYFIFKNKSSKTKDKLLYSFAGIMLFFEIVSRIVNLSFLDNWTFENVFIILVPISICAFMIFVFVIGLFTKSKILLNYSGLFGLVATTAYQLYPLIGLNQKYMTFPVLYSIVSHMVGFIAVMILFLFKRVEYNFKKIHQSYICIIIMFGYGAILNWILFPGSDYMYMRNDPLNLKLNFPYQILYGSLIVIYVFVFYLIANIKNIIKKIKKA